MSDYKPIRIFYSYAAQDEMLRRKLQKHLTMLRRRGIIQEWHYRKIQAGTEREVNIGINLETADSILLLVSADFLASDYCYEKEMTRALEKHNAGEALVIPLLIRSVDWTEAPFSKLSVLPTNAKPVTSWRDEDQAWANITQGIFRAIRQIRGDISTAESIYLGFTGQDTKGSELIFANIAVDSHNEYWYESFEAFMPYKSIVSSFGIDNPIMEKVIEEEEKRTQSTLLWFPQRWRNEPGLREYPFNELCAQNFYLADFVINADPSFDITLLNRGKKPVILNSVGIEVVRAVEYDYVYGTPEPVKLQVNDCYSIDMHDVSQKVWSILAESEPVDLYFNRPKIVDLHLIAPVRIPDPIYLPSGAPYRYKLSLDSYHLPNHSILRMWVKTDSGEQKSHNLYLFTL